MLLLTRTVAMICEVGGGITFALTLVLLPRLAS
jgi:hypothetical protein